MNPYAPYDYGHYAWSTKVDSGCHGWYGHGITKEDDVDDMDDMRLEEHVVLLEDLKDAARGLPVKFQKGQHVDDFLVTVYINGEQTGAIVRRGSTWFNVSTVVMGITEHDEPRRALARHINDYVDNRVGGY